MAEADEYSNALTHPTKYFDDPYFQSFLKKSIEAFKTYEGEIPRKILDACEATEEEISEVADFTMSERKVVRQWMSKNEIDNLDQELIGLIVGKKTCECEQETMLQFFENVVYGSPAEIVEVLNRGADPNVMLKGKLGPGSEVPLLVWCAMNGNFVPIPLLLAAGGNPDRKHKVMKVGKEVWQWSAKEQSAMLMSNLGELQEIPCNGCYNVWKTYQALHQ